MKHILFVNITALRATFSESIQQITLIFDLITKCVIISLWCPFLRSVSNNYPAKSRGISPDI